MMYSKKEKRFIRINFITIIALFLLILAGGVVRSTGSGMGCPDWPKCFDQYIPPTSISQLPVNYQEKYLQKRLEKNERFAKMLDKAGYKELADKIRHDEAIKIPEEFNASKTYTEYINRLIGAITGFLMLLTFIFSFTYFKSAKRIFALSFFNIVLVVFQAWLGSIVVATNLVAWIITVHMLVAILIIAVAIYTYHYARFIQIDSRNNKNANLLIRGVMIFSIILSLIQVIAGTEVREGIDYVIGQYPELGRSEWLDRVGSIFTYHKDLALAVIAVNITLFILIKRQFPNSKQYNFSIAVLALIGVQLFSGLLLSYWGMPPFAQAVHVLFAIMMFSGQFYLLLMFSVKKGYIKK